MSPSGPAARRGILREGNGIGRAVAPLALAAVSLLLFASCEWSPGPGSAVDPGSGASLVRHGAYLYMIGGLDADGGYSSTVRVARPQAGLIGRPGPREPFHADRPCLAHRDRSCRSCSAYRV